MPSPAASLNTLIYRRIFPLILQGFKLFFRPPIQRPLIALSPPRYCSSGVTLGEESGETIYFSQPDTYPIAERRFLNKLWPKKRRRLV
jgi:hypothetical protein